MNINQAAEMFSRYGGVDSAEQLLKIKPTEGQLLAARNRMMIAADQAMRAMREHHGMQLPPDPRSGDPL
jgi:hypothetical protein